jgi:hypothetical protein
VRESITNVKALVLEMNRPSDHQYIGPPPLAFPSPQRGLGFAPPDLVELEKAEFVRVTGGEKGGVVARITTPSGTTMDAQMTFRTGEPGFWFTAQEPGVHRLAIQDQEAASITQSVLASDPKGQEPLD